MSSPLTGSGVPQQWRPVQTLMMLPSLRKIFKAPSFEPKTMPAKTETQNVSWDSL